MVDVNNDNRLEQELKRSRGEWERKAYQLINEETILKQPCSQIHSYNHYNSSMLITKLTID